VQFEATVPAIRDRVVQGALKLILEPVFEADFQPGSYGYRPKRTAHGAIKRVAEAIVEQKTRVLDFDLRAYLDVASYYTFSFFERVEEVRSNRRHLNSYAFCPSAIDVNSLEFAALYTLQDSLSRDTE
jgi:hypothetical protein